ncbi:MAG: hypothetical protein IJG23_04290 [Clostridia bacterium]|nr:hypothetical protein [Clostridia bacterium]
MAAKKPKNRAKDIKKSLIEQLKNKHADIEAFAIQVDSYVAFYLLEHEAREYLKTHPHDKEKSRQAIAYNKQQLSILKQLGLSADTVMKLKEEDGAGGLM